MASAVEDLLQEACEVIDQPIETLARRVLDRDRDIDHEEVEIEQETIRLIALFQPMGENLRLLCTILKVTSDLERIADCAVNIAERGKHLQLQPVARQVPEFQPMPRQVREIVRNALQSFARHDEALARTVLGEDSAIDERYGRVIRAVIARASHDPTQIAAYLDLLSVAKNLERIADHATNIAEDVVYLATGAIVRHLGDEPAAAIQARIDA
jgi:phosphate transport system protein